MRSPTLLAGRSVRLTTPETTSQTHRGVEDDEDGPKAHAVGSSSARAASTVPVKSRLAIKPRALLLASRRRNEEASLLEVRTRLRQPRSTLWSVVELIWWVRAAHPRWTFSMIPAAVTFQMNGLGS